MSNQLQARYPDIYLISGAMHMLSYSRIVVTVACTLHMHELNHRLFYPTSKLQLEPELYSSFKVRNCYLQLYLSNVIPVLIL